MSKMTHCVRLIVLAAFAVFFAAEVQAVPCASISTGNWNTAGTWDCGHVPAAGDTVTITAGQTVTLNTNSASLAGLTVDGTLTIGNSGTARRLTVAGNISVTPTGTVNVTNSTVTHSLVVSGDIINDGTFDLRRDNNSLCSATFNGAATQTVSGTGALTEFYNVTANSNLTINMTGVAVTQTGTLSVTGNLDVQSGTLNLANVTNVTGTTSISGILNHTTTTGTRTFTGDVTINSGGTWSNTANEAITIRGNLTNNGTFNSGTGAYTLNGTAAQAITGIDNGTTSFARLTLNNANGLSLSGTHNVTVTTLLTLTSGNVTTNSNVLYISNGSNITRGTGFVIGNLMKSVATGTNIADIFEVGTGTTYAPVNTTFAQVTTAGNLMVSSTLNDHPQIASSGLDASQSVNRYWTLTNSGIGFTAYSATFNFVAGDVDTGANPLAMTAMLYTPSLPAAGTWIPTADSGNTTTSISVSGVTSFGDFAVGLPPGYSETLGRFNAYDPPPATPAGSIQGYIRTKVAGTAFNLTVVHLDSTGTTLQGFLAGTAVTVDLIDGTTATGTLANNCWTSWLAATAITSTTINFGGLWTQTTGTASFTVPNSYRDVRVRITGGGQTGCSSDRFAIRPASLTVSSVQDMDSATAFTGTGTARDLNNTSATGGNVHKAGQPFTIGATAYNAAATPVITSNYDGSPVAIVNTTLPAGGADGVLTPGAWTPNSGTVTTTAASYSEAGAFDLLLQDQGYASVDTADTFGDCTASGRYVCSAAKQVGRFVPDHFELTASTTPPVFRTFNVADAACSTPPSGATRSFTYIGQPFGYTTPPQATILARNAAGATTVNYSGALWKIGAGTASSNKDCMTNTDVCQFTTSWTGGSSAAESYGYTLTPASAPGWDNAGAATAAATVTAGSGLNNGTGTLAISSGTTLAFLRSTTPQAAFTANITDTISVTDGSEGGVATNGTITTIAPLEFRGTSPDGGVTWPGIGWDSGNQFRYGRLKLANAYGSELLKLPVSIQAQYWNGTAFVTNTADNCTMIPASSIVMDSFTQNLAACETQLLPTGNLTFAGGVPPQVRLSAPGAGNNGSVNLTVNVSITAAGNTCIGSSPSAATSAYVPWLDTNPARATFGVYRGSNEFIYLREAY